RSPSVVLRVFSTQLQRLRQLHAVRKVSIQGVVSAGLIGQQIRDEAAAYQFRQHVSTIAHKPYRDRFLPNPGVIDDAQSIVKVIANTIAITGADPLLDAGGVDINP